MTYKELYPIIQNLKKSLDSYVIANDCVNDYYYIAKSWLNDIDNLIYVNSDLRLEFETWLHNGSTIKLRNLLTHVGCDYWGNIAHSNACDLLDSVKCKN